MKGIYLTECDVKDLNSGVSKKIVYQLEAFREAGIEMELLDRNSIKYASINKVKSVLLNLQGINSKLVNNLCVVLEKRLEGNDIDFIYIRQIMLDLPLVNCLKRIKQKYCNIKILFEIPTYPYDKEMHVGQSIILLNDIKARKCLLGAIDRIVTYSKDGELFGISTLSIINGIRYDLTKQVVSVEHKGINFIAVALFDKWHGYDRFIRGMANDKDLLERENIKLYLVGKGKAIPEYKTLVKKLCLEERVIFTDELHGKELDDVYNIADIALDSMGRHRVGVYFNSTLKGKEYCAHGLPIVSGVETELDSLSDAFFYQRVPADDSDVSMRKMVDFYYELKKNMNLPFLIRSTTMPLFDFNEAYQPVVDYLLNSKI